VGPKLFFQCAGFLRKEFIFHFVFQKFNFVSKEIIEFPPRLSYSVNESQSEVVVREGDSLSIRTKAQSD
jgi:hypothetical protein